MSTGQSKCGDTGPGAGPGSGGPPEGLHQGSSVEMGRRSFPWLGKGVPPKSTCRAQLGDSARTGFLVLASFVGPFQPWQPGIMDLTLQQPLFSACADPSTPDNAWEQGKRGKGSGLGG